jgi:hypothetical protein
MAKSRDPRSGHIRSGDEPTHARSALRMRRWLALFGLVNGITGVIVFEFLGSVPFVVVSGALCLVSAVNLTVVMRHIRQGPHYQPGRTIPPYRPVEDAWSAQRRKPRKVTPLRTRRIRYLVMMITCMVLIILAWTWVRFYSVAAAGAMTLVAAVIPPFAAVITNADSPIIHGEAGPEDGEPGPGESGDVWWDDRRRDQ